MSARAFALVALAIVVGCKDPPSGSARLGDAREAALGGDANGTSSPSATSTTRDASPGVEGDAGVLDGAALDASAVSTASIGDAGPSACRLLYGPQKLAFVGPAALKVEGTELVVVANDLGKPRLTRIAIPPILPLGTPAEEVSRPLTTVGATWPPCVTAGAYAICPGRAGSITRTLLAGGATKEIVKGRPATRIAAAALGEHTVTAFLDEKQTSEGRTLIAFAMLDDGEPVRLSDEGSGATFIDLATHGTAIVAMYLDARTSMVPIHERTLTEKNGKLDLGKDVVVAVGGAPERGIAGRVAVSAKHVFFIVPMPEDALSFGMATITLNDPPREEEKLTYSLYPNGIDPAPVAVSHGVSPVRIVRVRPAEKMAGAQRALEMGALADDGTFRADGLLSIGKRVSDLDVVTDALGTAWILYGDAADTWLERRACP